jgi:uncharacterized protein (TIGR02099 family)
MKKILIKSIDFTSHTILVGFILAVLFIAVASSLLRHYLPNINEYRTFFLEQINQQSDTITIDAKEISSEWNLFKPEIILHDVSLRSDKLDDDLHFKKLQIRFNFISSLLNQGLYFDYIELANLHIVLIEDENGQWSFANLESKNREKQSITRLLDRLWTIDEVVLRNIHLSLLPYDKKVVELPRLNAYFSSYKHKKHFNVQLMEGNQQIGRLIVDTKHRIKTEDFSAKAYLNIDKYPVAEVASLIPATAMIKEGNISSELWMYWQNEQLAFEGKVEVDQIDIKQDKKTWELESFASTIYGAYDQSQLTIALPQAKITASQKLYNFTSIKLVAADYFNLQIANVDISDLYALSKSMPLNVGLKEVLDTLSPAGVLRNVNMNFGFNKPFEINAELKNISVNAWHGAPALTSVDGYIYATKSSGFVEINTTKFTLFFPNIYHQAMHFDAAKGYVDWEIGEDNIYVSGHDLVLESESGRARGEFAFKLPKNKSLDNPPLLSLMVGMRDSAAQYRDIFIPFIVSDKLLEWLDNNIRKASLPEVAFIFHGPTVSDVLDKKSIQLWLDVQDGAITYLKDWPVIENINGEFLLDDDLSFARVSSALTQSINIHAVDFSMFPREHTQHLKVTASVDGYGNDAMNFLKNPALASIMNDTLDDWLVKGGTVKANLSIDADLSNAVNTQIDISAILNNIAIHLPKNNLHIDKVSGAIGFHSLTGLQSDLLTGAMFNKSITASISSNKKSGKLSTIVKAKGEVDVVNISPWIGSSLSSFLTGSAWLNMQLQLSEDQADLILYSDLKGVVVDIPKPLNKKIKEIKNLRVLIPLIGDKREVAINYGEGINARFLVDEKGAQSGIINLGLNNANYQKGKIVLGGQIVEVDVEEWLDVIAKYSKADPLIVDEDSGHDPLIFLVKNLRIKTLKAYDQTLDSVSLDIFNTVSYWQLGIDHQSLKASLRIYDNKQPMELQLHRLDLNFLSKKQEESGVGMANHSWKDFPDIDVIIEKLIANNENYGEWEFKLRSYDDFMALEDIRASFKSLRLSSDIDEGATLKWTFGETPQTSFKGKFVANNIADVLKAWGYEQEIYSKKAEFIVDAKWKGVPMDFSADVMAAKSQFRLERGSFANVNPTSTGALKFIGVFNIANLIKRLQLDFSDLTSQGLSYESVLGSVDINHGVYYFEQPVVVKSTTSKIRFYGGFDMNTEQLDMTMGVTLPLASNLPWIVALAAGLPTAAGVYIISKVLDKQVDQISSAVYKVTGSFTDPQIKFDSLFDTEDGYEKQRNKSQSTEANKQDVSNIKKK